MVLSTTDYITIFTLHTTNKLPFIHPNTFRINTKRTACIIHTTYSYTKLTSGRPNEPLPIQNHLVLLLATSVCHRHSNCSHTRSFGFYLRLFVHSACFLTVLSFQFRASDLKFKSNVQRAIRYYYVITITFLLSA